MQKSGAQRFIVGSTNPDVYLYQRLKLNSPLEPKAKSPEFLEARSANDKPEAWPKPNEMGLCSVKDGEVKCFSLPLRKTSLMSCSCKKILEKLSYLHLILILTLFITVQRAAQDWVSACYFWHSASPHSLSKYSHGMKQYTNLSINHTTESSSGLY